MIIGRGTAYVEMDVRERVPDWLPCAGDLRVEVTVRLQEFGGRYAGVWIAEPELVRFVDELERLVRTGTGRVTLESISPNELMLAFEPRNPRGVLLVQVQLGRHQYSGETYSPTSVTGGFEIQPDELESALTGFKAMLSLDPT